MDRDTDECCLLIAIPDIATEWSVWSEYNDFVVKVEKRQAGKAGNRAQVILKGVCLRYEAGDLKHGIDD